MEFDEDRFNLLSEQLNQCLLPEFDHEIGNQPLGKADFHTFCYGLNMNLQLLFDVIAKNEQLLRGPFGDNESFRLRFILLIHQQTGSEDAPFQTDVQPILHQLKLLANKHYKDIFSKPMIRTNCLNYYKERLVDSKWKKNIGAVFGYIQMYKIHRHLMKTNLGSDETMFMLSVAMLLVDYFEPLYKQFGLFLFKTILDFGSAEYLSKMNIFEVIYKRIMNPLIHVIKEERGTVIMLSCLYKCIQKFDKWQNPSDWNEVDDVLNDILRRLAMESDNRLTAILITFISSLTTLPMQKTSHLSLNTDFENIDQIKMLLGKTAAEKRAMFIQLRETCQTYHNLLVGRWTKKIFEVLLQQPIGGPEETQLHLHVMHVCYLCCFYGNPLMAGANCLEFLNKSIISYLQMIKRSHNNQVFAHEIKEILGTFVDHLNRRSNDGEQTEMSTFRKSIEDLNTELSQKFEEINLNKMK